MYENKVVEVEQLIESQNRWREICINLIASENVVSRRVRSQAGSDFAVQCLCEYEAADSSQPSPDHAVFHYYNFATVGRRDEQGQYIHREKFYDLPADFYAEYQSRVRSYLCEVAADVEMS